MQLRSCGGLLGLARAPTVGLFTPPAHPATHKVQETMTGLFQLSLLLTSVVKAICICILNSVTIVSTNMLVLTIVTMFKMQMQITLTADADKDADADSLYERVQQFNCTFFLLGGAIDFFFRTCHDDPGAYSDRRGTVGHTWNTPKKWFF